MVDDGVVAVNAIPHHNGVHTLQEMAFVSIRVNLCDPWDIMAFATHAHKAHYTEDKHRAC